MIHPSRLNRANSSLSLDDTSVSSPGGRQLVSAASRGTTGAISIGRGGSGGEKAPAPSSSSPSVPKGGSAGGSLHDERGAVLMCGVTKSRRKGSSGRKVRRASSGSELDWDMGGAPFLPSAGLGGRGPVRASSDSTTTTTTTTSSSSSSSNGLSHIGSIGSIGSSNDVFKMDVDMDGEPEREVPSAAATGSGEKEKAAHASKTECTKAHHPPSSPLAAGAGAAAATKQQQLPAGWRRCSLISHLPSLPPLTSAAGNLDVYRGPTDESNWVIPGRLMVGAYPASLDQALHERQISSILGLGIRTFVCLQREYDGAATEEQWRTGQRIRPYIRDAAAMLGRSAGGNGTANGNNGNGNGNSKREEVKFLHCPIVDCDTTADEIIVELATNLLRRLDVGEMIYLHCWGGHGRAGTVASLLVGLLYGMNGAESMEYIQALHDTRRFPLDTPSPQTQKQRDQVSRILRRFYAEKAEEK